MEANKKNREGLRLLGVALLLMAIPVAVFWRPHLFFFVDDWTALIHMVDNPFWQYLNQTDAEQWFPMFHLAYYLMIKVFGDRYEWMLLVCCLGTGINAFLVYLLFRRHLRPGTALLLSLFYSAAVVHTATVWHAYNICYVLSLGFFLGALLLTDRYLRSPSPGGLVGIGLCAWFSITSHSFAIMVISSIPLYGLLLGGAGARDKFWKLAAVIGAVYLLFALGYSTFAGMGAASSHNRQILSSLPGPTYFFYFLFGALFYPFSYFLGGDLSLVKAFFVGLVVSGAVISIILIKGSPQERRLAVWALVINFLPFLLVGLARYKLGLFSAGVHRYAIFTLVGALLLAGTAWDILAGNRLSQFWTRLLALVLMALMIGGQFRALPWVQRAYDRGSKAARLCYQQLNLSGETSPPPGEKPPLFCPETHPFLTRDQAVAIRRFLEGMPEKP